MPSAGNYAMAEITCTLIPLYRFWVRYETDDGKTDYEWVGVSDTISGLVKLIAERELVYSMKDCPKYLDIDDFLLMPCEESKITGYHLFDINEHDIAQFSPMFDESCYEISLSNPPIPVIIPSGTYNELYDTMKTIHGDDFWQGECSGILADSLYKSEMVWVAVANKRVENELHEQKEIKAGSKVISYFAHTPEFTQGIETVKSNIPFPRKGSFQ
jgi:hypothetical protein